MQITGSTVGHCTDSAGNFLCALVKLASPSTFHKFDDRIRFVGLKMKEFVFYAPILREIPSIAYPCWDHSGRTSIRNLMNENIKVVCEVIPPSNSMIQRYSFATIYDLKALKSKSPSCKIKHSDISYTTRASKLWCYSQSNIKQGTRTTRKQTTKKDYIKTFKIVFYLVHAYNIYHYIK